MAQEMDTLIAAVTRNTSVVGSAVVLLDGIKARLDAAGQDPVKLKALSDELGSTSDQAAAAIARNTPAE